MIANTLSTIENQFRIFNSIHRVLGIKLNILIPTYLQSATLEKVSESITKLNKPKLELKKNELI
jgi:hypothetical protein